MSQYFFRCISSGSTAFTFVKYIQSSTNYPYISYTIVMEALLCIFRTLYPRLYEVSAYVDLSLPATLSSYFQLPLNVRTFPCLVSAILCISPLVMGSSEQLAEYKDSFFRMASSALSASKVGWTRARQVGNFCVEKNFHIIIIGEMWLRKWD